MANLEGVQVIAIFSQSIFRQKFFFHQYNFLRRLPTTQDILSGDA
jgi:hypothetical protein